MLQSLNDPRVHNGHRNPFIDRIGGMCRVCGEVLYTYTPFETVEDLIRNIETHNSSKHGGINNA